MGFRATLETNSGETFRLVLPQGQHGGKALLTFLEAVEIWHTTPGDEAVQTWFIQVEAHLKRPVYDVIQPLTQAWYCGEWGYREDAYALFQCDSPGTLLTEADFKQAVQAVAARWGAISPLTDIH